MVRCCPIDVAFESPMVDRREYFTTELQNSTSKNNICSDFLEHCKVCSNCYKNLSIFFDSRKNNTDNLTIILLIILLVVILFKP